MQIKQQWTIAGSIGTIAVMVGLWTSLDPWPKIGWETPNGHEQDIAMVEAKALQEIKNTQTAMQIFRDEWQCSQWSKELTMLYDQTNAGDDSRRLQDQIERQRQKMDERTCERFSPY